MTQTTIDINALKSGGIIKQRQRDLFTVRTRCPGGRLTAAKLKKIAEVAEKYGNGELHTSFRQSVEILYVNFKYIDAVRAQLAEAGIEIASCGPRVRVPTACGGCEYNPNGWTDTVKLCMEVDKKYFGIDTPHKFKMSFSGCTIDCPRSREMDLGFAGIVDPQLDISTCSQCGSCVQACDDDAIKMNAENFPQYFREKCIFCGDCVKVCPTESWTAKRIGHKVFVGGKGGKHPRAANPVAYFVPDDKVNQLIEATLSWYKSNAEKRERIGYTLDRLGLEKFVKEVIVPLGLEAAPPDRQ
jgi:dissimilatory sulfite reductase (desulfoviridin) alpha/beta subunit